MMDIIIKYIAEKVIRVHTLIEGMDTKVLEAVALLLLGMMMFVLIRSGTL